VAAPEGAAGFKLGEDAPAVEKTCTNAGHTWKALPDDRFSCSGAPVDLGFPVNTGGKLCEGRLCAVSIHAAREETWAELAARYAKLLASLQDKYGSPANEASEALGDCSSPLTECFKRGRTKT